jgi:hypothetical protein
VPTANFNEPIDQRSVILEERCVRDRRIFRASVRGALSQICSKCTGFREVSKLTSAFAHEYKHRSNLFDA